VCAHGRVRLKGKERRRQQENEKGREDERERLEEKRGGNVLRSLRAKRTVGAESRRACGRVAAREGLIL